MAISAKPGDDPGKIWRPDEPVIGPEVSVGESEDEVLLASSSSDSTFDAVDEALEEGDVTSSRIDHSDISRDGDEIFIGDEKASEFEGKIFYRPKTWLSDVSEEREMEKMGLMAELETEYDVDFFGQPQSALIARDKKATKNVFESKGVETVEDYDLDEAYDRLEEGESLVVKPRMNSCKGRGVRKVESSQELDEYVRRASLEVEDVEEDLLVEEHLPHDERDDVKDMRMVVVGDEVYRKGREDGDGICNNIDNNGEYVEAPQMSMEEKELARKSKEIFGEGFYAVDYIRDHDGGVKVMENNDTPGTKISSELPVDLREKIGEAVRYQNSGTNTRPSSYGREAKVV